MLRQLVFLLVIAALLGCRDRRESMIKAQEEAAALETASDVEEKADKTYTQSVFALVDTILTASKMLKVCEIAAAAAVVDESQACGASIIQQVCALHVSEGSTVLKLSLAGEEFDEHVAKFTGPVIGAFRGAVVECLKSATVKKVKDVALEAGLQTTEAFQAAGTDAVVDAAVDTTAETVTSTATDVAAAEGGAAGAGLEAGTKPWVWAKAVAYVACRGATAVIASAIDTHTAANGETEDIYQCTSAKDWLTSGTTWSACAKTAGSLCAVASLRGIVNVENFLPTIESDSGKIAAQVGSAVVSGACLLGAEATKLACSVISSAAGQIKMAIETGNNDWAQCLGLDRLGACIGYHWGSGGWTNNEPVAQAVSEGELTYKPCCWCYRDYFVDDRLLFKDSQIHRQHWVGVIQEGDFQTGNCAQMERKGKLGTGETDNNDDVYYRYVDCRKAYLKGDACAIPEATQTFEVWDPTGKRWRTKKNHAREPSPPETGVAN